MSISHRRFLLTDTLFMASFRDLSATPLQAGLVTQNSPTHPHLAASTEYGSAHDDLIVMTQLLDLATDAIIVRDLAGRIEFWNRGAETTYGWTRADARGQISHILLRATYPQPRELIETALLRDGAWEGEVRHATRTGRQLIAQSRWTLRRDASGHPRQVLEIISDITARKEAEANLERSKQAAEAASRAKSAFLASMSHEIRTPLGIILGFAELLINPDLSEHERRSGLEIIQRNGHLLSGIINDVLDLSKVEAGKLKVERLRVPLATLLDDVEENMRFAATNRGLSFTITQQGVLPAIALTDPIRLKQILFNIIGNAIKFTHRGGVDVRVSAAPPVGEATQIIFEVLDTGCGMTPEEAGRIFRPFTQADSSTTRQYGGTGLGLTLARHLAHLLEGEVELVRTQPGIGSHFRVLVAAGLSEASVSATSLDIPAQPRTEVCPASTLPAAPARLEGLRILLVEDAADIRLLVARVLGLAGAVVDTAVDGQEAIEKALSRPFDVILMDIQMPLVDGYAATSALRRRGLKTPIIALTAHAMKEEKARCLAIGFDDHLGKPIDRVLLEQALSKYMPAPNAP